MNYKFNKFYYKPLPDNLTIKNSVIEGLGLFATENIAADTDLGMTHIKIPIINGYVRTPLGGFLNHTETPNCCLIELLDWDDYRIYHLHTIRHINEGDELTLNYHVDEEEQNT